MKRLAIIALLGLVGCADRESIEAEDAASAQASGNSSLVIHDRYLLGGYRVHEFITTEGAHCVIAAGHLECSFPEIRR